MTLGRADVKIRLPRRCNNVLGAHTSNLTSLASFLPSSTNSAGQPTHSWGLVPDRRAVSEPTSPEPLIASGQILRGWRGMKFHVEPLSAPDSLTCPPRRNLRMNFRVGVRFCALPTGRQAGKSSPTS